jgi:hypothetical protein
VAQFLAVPPSIENAAPLYLDALFEFSAEVAPCFPEDERTRRANVAQERSSRLDAILSNLATNPNSDQSDAIETLLKDYEVGFQTLVRAQKRKRCAFETALTIVASQPHVHAARQVLRVVELRNRRDLDSGDFEHAIDDLQIVLRLSRDLRPRGDMLAQLVSCSINRSAYLNLVPRILAAPEVTVKHCDRLMAVLAEHENSAIDPFLEGSRAQYVVARTLLGDLQHRTGLFAQGVLEREFGGSSKSIGPFLADMHFDVDRENSKTSQPQVYAAWMATRMLDLRLMTMTAADWTKEVQTLNRYYRSLLELTSLPGWQRAPEIRRLADEMPGAELVKILADHQPGAALPPEAADAFKKFALTRIIAESDLGSSRFAEALVRSETELAGTKCLIALRRWQLEHEELPTNLDVIVKAAGMPAVPIDPYADQPMRLTVLNGEPVIYSVGPDRQDDHAAVDWKGEAGKSGDVSFRISGRPSDSGQ